MIAAARPIISPRGHRVRGARQSTTTITISSRLIWPNASVWATGSISSAAGSASIVADTAPGRPPAGQATRAVRKITTVRAATDSPNTAISDTQYGTTASGIIVIAANTG